MHLGARLVHAPTHPRDEPMIERYLRYRAQRQSFQPGDRAALRRWLSMLRDEGAIAPAALPPLTPLDRIFKDFEDYLRAERALAPSSIGSYLPTIRRFLHEICPIGACRNGPFRRADNLAPAALWFAAHGPWPAADPWFGVTAHPTAEWIANHH